MSRHWIHWIVLYIISAEFAECPHCSEPEVVLLFLGVAASTEPPLSVGGRALSERIGNGDQGQWDDAFEALMVRSPLTSK